MNPSTPPRRPPRVAVVGSLNMDLVASVPELPRAGQTVTGRSLMRIAGGKGANQAVAAARLGADVTMIGHVGDDDFGIELRRGLQEDGIDVTGVTVVPESSGVAIIAVDDAGENQIIIVPGANGRVTPADVRAHAAAIEAADVLLLQLEIPLESVREASEIARRHGVRVVLDPPAVANDPGLLPHCDVMVPNESELLAWFGIECTGPGDAPRVATALGVKPIERIVVTLGGQGALAIGADSTLHASAFPVQVRDTTASGDAFAASLAVALAEGREWPVALRWACAAGALTATRPGARPSLPTRPEVESLANT